MILVALGSNLSGAWGAPSQILNRAVLEMGKPPDTAILGLSGLYETAGVGRGRPGVFVNAVVSLECHCSASALLRRLKMIEHRAGPRSSRRWGPRTLDLDILDYRGLIARWPQRGRLNEAAIRNQLVLPHPLLHERPFVLAPLDEVAPDWRHPVLRRTARQLWRRKRDERSGRVLMRVGDMHYPMLDDPLALMPKSA
ncbi:2-amino-4-hydroxy-6-hydroxymethyldihydropteridine pyrophosphokinase [bacterium BMS3Bbin10]|nr:2-amino-4-hydroxy-6-hydroxymethyldihydropteridine pyrophosphokinase [bacterium BMS3Bbin10]